MIRVYFNNRGPTEFFRIWSLELTEDWLRLLYDGFVITSFLTESTFYLFIKISQIAPGSFMIRINPQPLCCPVSGMAHISLLQKISMSLTTKHFITVFGNPTVWVIIQNTWPTNHAVVTTNHSQVKHPLTQTGILWSFACPPTQYEISMESLKQSHSNCIQGGDPALLHQP